MSKALVLGGGGTLGISWETGLLAGLLDDGVDVTDADLIVGTSAGSVVGAQIVQGKTIPELVAAEVDAPAPALGADMEFDIARVTEIFGKWIAMTEVTEEALAEIGALALTAKTASEERWVDSFQMVQPDWPDREYMVTAVDAASGRFKAWTKQDGIDLRRAVASSCAIPGVFPCVEYAGARYMDGGPRSGTSADLAAGHDTVLVIAPLGVGERNIDPISGRLARAEVEALRAAGSRVELIFPDEASMEIMGPNRMDPSKRSVMVDEGRRQATGLADTVAALWSA